MSNTVSVSARGRLFLLAGEQVKAARALARLDQRTLAELASVSVETIKRIEAIRGPINANANTLRRLIDAFRSRNVMFIETAEGLNIRMTETNHGLEVISDPATRDAYHRPAAHPPRHAAFDGSIDAATLLNELPAMISYWDTGLRCRMANAAYLDWFALTADQINAMHMRDLLGPTLFDMNDPDLRMVLQGVAQAFSRTVVKPNGEVGHTWVQYVPDLNDEGEMRGFKEVATDISKLTQVARR